MASSLKAVVIEVTGGDVRNHHVNLNGALGFFPEDCLGGSNEGAAAKSIEVSFGSDVVSTDVDATKSMFREHGAIRQFFKREKIIEGDIVLIERLAPRSYHVFKASKRALKYHL